MGLLCQRCSAWVEIEDDGGEVVCDTCRAAKAAGETPKREVPSRAKKRPTFWVSDEELASPMPEPEVWNPSDQSSSLMDLQMIVAECGASTRAPARRIDDDLVRLDAPVFLSTEPPAPEPAVDPTLDGADTDSGTTLDGASTEPEPAEIAPAARIAAPPPNARALALKIGPWALAGAAALGGILWLASGGEPSQAPDARATLEAVAPKPASEPMPQPPPEPAQEVAAPAGPATPAPETAPPADARPEIAAPAPKGAAVVVAPPAAAPPAAQPATAHHPFNRAAAISALAGAAGRASGCRKPGDPKGQAKVTVTFAATGRPAQVQVAPPFAGTRTGACAAAAFRGATVPAFEGQPVPVSKGVSLR